MQLSETSDGHPSNPNDHTSRIIDFGRVPKPAGNFIAAVNPQKDVPFPESPVDPTSITGASSHTHPTALRQGASFILERPGPTLTSSRRNSWSSFSHALPYEFPISLGQKATRMQELESRDEYAAVLRRKESSALLRRLDTTMDMAFFLKNTGPPSPKEGPSKEELKRPMSRKMGLGIFKKKMDKGVSTDKFISTERLAGLSALEDRVPVQAKVTLQGTKYLQIIPHPTPFRVQSGNLACSLPRLTTAHRLSISLLENSETYGTETIDYWISSFTNQNAERKLSLNNQSPKDFEVFHTTLTDSTPRQSIDFMSGARLSSEEANGFGQSMIDNAAHNLNRAGASQLYHDLRSNPPRSLSPSRVHKRSVSIQVQDITSTARRGFAPGNQEPSNPIIETNSTIGKENYDRRFFDILAGQGLRRPIRAQNQVSARTSSDRSKALPKLPNEAEDRRNEGDGVVYTMAMMQARRDRDVAIRARNIKQMQRARRNTTESVKQIKREEGSSNHKTTAMEDCSSEQGYAAPPSTAPFSQAQTLVGFTPSKAIMALSQVKLVAEQLPVPRVRQINKPAPLLLQARMGGKAKAIPVRNGELDSSPSLLKDPATLEGTRFSFSPPGSVASTGQAPVLLPSTRYNEGRKPVSSGRITSTQTPLLYSTTPAEGPPPPPPPRSLARLTGNSASKRPKSSSASTSSTASNPYSITFPKRTSSLLSGIHLDYTVQPSMRTPKAAPSTSIPNISTRTLQPPNQTSIASSSTPSSIHARLTFRVENLERENRLLEAALMAVVRTGGTINHCPCGFLNNKDRIERATSKSPRTRPSSRMSNTHPSISVAADQTPSNKPPSRSSSTSTPTQPIPTATTKPRCKHYMGDARGSLDFSLIAKNETSSGGGSNDHLSVRAVDGSGSGSDVVRRKSVQSNESGESSISALEVYLGTRIST